MTLSCPGPFPHKSNEKLVNWQLFLTTILLQNVLLLSHKWGEKQNTQLDTLRLGWKRRPFLGRTLFISFEESIAMVTRTPTDEPGKVEIIHKGQTNQLPGHGLYILFSFNSQVLLICLVFTPTYQAKNLTKIYLYKEKTRFSDKYFIIVEME